MADTALVKVAVTMYQVGFGDCFLLSFDYASALDDGRCERHVLMDFGSHSSRPRDMPGNFHAVAELLRDHCSGQLDAVVVTHFHRDHVLGFSDRQAGGILEALAPRLVIFPWTYHPRFRRTCPEPKSLSPIRRAAAMLDRLASTASCYLCAGDSCPLDALLPGVHVRVFGPPAVPHLSPNNTSLILLWEVGTGPSRKLLLFPGDAEIESWSHTLESRDLLDLLPHIDLYKVSHHGSATGNPDSLLGRLPLCDPPRMTALLSVQAGVFGNPGNDTEVPDRVVEARLRASTHLVSTRDIRRSAPPFLRVSADVAEGSRFGIEPHHAPEFHHHASPSHRR